MGNSPAFTAARLLDVLAHFVGRNRFVAKNVGAKRVEVEATFGLIAVF